MPDASSSSAANRLFESLSSQTRERLRPHVRTVRLDKGRTIYNVGAPVRYALFPMNGMVALLATTEDADTLAVAMVGSDGVIGVPPFLPANTSPYDVIVQIPCDALRVSTDTLLHEFNRAEDLQRVLLDYPLCQDS